MSRAEEITGEVSRVVQTCRRLEAQLQQSIPKKIHEEAVAKLQASVDDLSAELSRAKSEIENTAAIGQRIATIESRIASQNETISSQSLAFESFSSKLAENSIPFTAYSDAISKVQTLEERVSSMVDSNEYAAATKRCAELEDQIGSMVPRAQYASVELELAQSVPLQKYEDLLRNFEQMVPRSELTDAESRIVDLERALANSVPRQDFEDLTGRIAQITREATELVSRPLNSPVTSEVRSEPAPADQEVPVALDTPALETFTSPNDDSLIASPLEEFQIAPPVEHIEVPQEVSAPEVVASVLPESVVPEIVEQASSPQTEVNEVEQPTEFVTSQAEVTVSQAPFEVITDSETPVQLAPEPSVEVEAAAPAPQIEQAATVTVEPPQEPASAPEISEVQSSLAELNTTIETGVTASPEPQGPLAVEYEKGFRFSNTEFCAKSGLEFLEDVEKLDISVISSHSQNGDFERWFHDILVDEASAQSLKVVRESNAAGEELRTLLVAAIAPKYRSS